MTTARKNTLSKVMKAAWTIFRKEGQSFAAALKKAWGWSKKQNSNDGTAFYSFVAIEKETDKAFNIRMRVINTYGATISLNVWFPKSQVEVNAHNVIAPEWLFAAKRRDLNILAFADAV